MRYSSSESTTLAGKFTPGSSVTIKVVNIDTDSLLTVTSNVCNESIHIPGLFLFSTNKINSSLQPFTNCAYEMTDGTNIFYGKFVYGGYVDQLPRRNEVQDLISNLQTSITDLINNHDGDVKAAIQELESGLIQILTNLNAEINENQVIIEDSSKSWSVSI